MEMGKFIVEHWQPLWNKEERREPIEASMARFDYHRKVVTARVRQPTLIDYEDAIRDTNNSCAGPDGIPFSVYRALSAIVAPIICEVGAALARGVRPPEGSSLQFCQTLPLRNGALKEKDLTQKGLFERL